MLSTDIPILLPAAFANAGTKNTIPTYGTVLDALFSLEIGAPPRQSIPPTIGGANVAAADFNGALFAISAPIRYVNAGNLAPFNATLSTAVGGYAKGAIVQKASNIGFWQSIVDNNTVNPSSSTSNWISFSPGVETIGAAVNVVMNVATASATATITADELTVKTALGGSAFLLSSFSHVIDLSTTGAGGMDTGTAPVSGFVSVYAIYNPTANTGALLACAEATSNAEVYSGANMPTGYTASALLSVRGTTAASFFVVASQNDRTVTPARTIVLSGGTQTVYTAFSLSTCVPLKAKSCNGYSVMLTAASIATTSNVFVSTDGVGVGSGLRPYQLPGLNTTVTGVIPWAIAISSATPQTLYYKTLNATADVGIVDYTF